MRPSEPCSLCNSSNLSRRRGYATVMLTGATSGRPQSRPRGFEIEGFR